MKSILTKKILFAAAILAFMLFFASQLPTSDGNGNVVNWYHIFVWLFVGLIVFLFGMGEMEFAMKAVAGNKMRNALKSLTNNPIKGAGAGLVTTALVQSSSVTTVMLISFVSAGLLTFAKTIPPIIGAIIGTTVTVQIISFNVTVLIPILLIAGFGAMKLLKSKQQQRAGRIFLGLGFIFWGMELMKGAMEPLRGFQPFLDIMLNMENVVLAILVAMLFTALVQSSAATIGVVIVFASQGLISLEAAIALTLGANIGTTVTAGLASIGKSRSAVRVAVAHSLFKFFGVAVFVWFIPQFAEFVQNFTAYTNSLLSLESAGDLPARHVANAHTLFSVGVALMVLPFSTQFAKLVEKIIPQKKRTIPAGETRYLVSEENIEDAPLAAIDGARLEIGRMGKKVSQMFKEIIPAIYAADIDLIKNIAEQDDQVDKLFRKIIKYLSKIRTQELTSDLSSELEDVTEIARYMEQIGDIVETNLAPAGIKLAEKNIFISDGTQELIAQLHSMIYNSLRLLLDANNVLAKHADRKSAIIQSRNVAIQIKKMREDIEDASEAVFARTDARLTKAYAAEADMVEALVRAYYLARNAAKVMADK